MSFFCIESKSILTPDRLKNMTSIKEGNTSSLLIRIIDLSSCFNKSSHLRAKLFEHKKKEFKSLTEA